MTVFIEIAINVVVKQMEVVGDALRRVKDDGVRGVIGSGKTGARRARVRVRTVDHVKEECFSGSPARSAAIESENVEASRRACAASTSVISAKNQMTPPVNVKVEKPVRATDAGEINVVIVMPGLS